MKLCKPGFAEGEIYFYNRRHIVDVTVHASDVHERSVIRREKKDGLCTY